MIGSRAGDGKSEDSAVIFELNYLLLEEYKLGKKRGVGNMQGFC